MEKEPEFVPGGGITTPRGFKAGATDADIKNNHQKRLDLGILYSEAPCSAEAVFTANQVKAAPVLLSRERLKGGMVRALVVNSGCANSCTGRQGMQDADEMTELAARHIGVRREEVLVSSTGVIGTMLPMERIRDGISRMAFSQDGGHDLARAIMTTDRVPKEVCVQADSFTIGGIAKGSGMIHPNLATLLCFLTTDAPLDATFLKTALKEAVDVSFNMISVDGDNSTNDTVLVMANGLAGGRLVAGNSPRSRVFRESLEKVCVYLAREVARDGEGAHRLIEVKVSGAKNTAEARLAARTIVSSNLFKAAVYGADPNWGRIVAAAGRSGAVVIMEKIGLAIGGIPVVENGSPVEFDKEIMITHLRGTEIFVDLDLNLGRGTATAWGCDLSEEYVKINAEYTT